MTKPANTVRATLPAGNAAAPDAEAEARAALERGDHTRALSILMEAHGAAIYRYCQRMAGALAEDAYQITFVQAYESLARFRGASTLRAWLFGIARHRCYDLLRKERRRPAKGDEGVAAAAQPGSLVDERLAAREVLARCLEGLKPKIREAVLLRYQEGLSYPEMAEVCGEDAATLQMRVTRALPRLRKCIEARSRR